jgi:F-type H+-transporting ATPase subunit b
VNINLTLVIQIIVFVILIWVVMTFIWPIILEAMDEREKKIAAGLAAAEKGEKSLAEAREKSEAIIREARDRARQIEDQAARRANETIDTAKQTALGEGARLVEAARQSALTETTRVRDQLRREYGSMVVAGASRLLEREIDAAKHAQLLDKLADEIGRG